MKKLLSLLLSFLFLFSLVPIKYFGAAKSPAIAFDAEQLSDGRYQITGSFVDCVGLISGKLLFQYQADQVKIDSAKMGKDAETVRDINDAYFSKNLTTLNTYSFDFLANATEYGFYFYKNLWSSADWAKETKLLGRKDSVNGENFEFIVFTVQAKEDSSIGVTGELRFDGQVVEVNHTIQMDKANVATPGDAGETDVATPGDAGKTDVATPGDADKTDVATPGDADVTSRVKPGNKDKTDGATPGDADVTGSVKLGDVDENGEIEASDARLTLRASVKLENFNFRQSIIADIDDDDELTSADARRTLRTAVSLEKIATIAEKELPVVDDDHFVVKFNLNYNSARPQWQSVLKNKNAVCPEAPERDNYAFMGWYTSSDLKTEFDFYHTLITSDIELFAYWIDIADKTDTDKDGLTDPAEKYFGTDPAKKDTDKDGLSDYDEVMIFNTDPLAADTDGNGIVDGKEDFDNDSLLNERETASGIGTNPFMADTDSDGLNDDEEIKIGTDPLKPDTDGDGVSDGKEVELGTDPLTVQSTFEVKEVAEGEDSVKVSVDISLPGEQVDSLSVEKNTNTALFPEEIPGYMGAAYDFNVDGEIETATISFEFDETLADDDNIDPVIYYFNEEEQSLEPLETTVVGNTASAVVEHFSTYILIDRKVYEKAFEWVDLWSDEQFTGVELVLVIDDSGSMRSNDTNNERLTVARTLLESLPKNSKVGIIHFESDVEVLTPNLLSDKDAAMNYLTTEYFKSNGNTMMYQGIQKAFDLFESDDKEILKVIVDLSDGIAHDTSLHNAVVNTAIDKNIRVYTVGLGRSTDYFYNYLMPLASNTNGQFYLAANASELSVIYEDIGDKIDINVDSDKDGIPDYYEDNMVAFNGVRIPLDKNNPDTDGDGLLDGEEIIIRKYGLLDGNEILINDDNKDSFSEVKVFGKIESNPALVDTDGDGIPDKTDTAKLTRGHENGIIGALKIVSYLGDGSMKSIDGHAFLSYTSFVNDKLSLYGVQTSENNYVSEDGDNSWVTSSSFKFNSVEMKPNYFVTIGTWAGWLNKSQRGTYLENEWYGSLAPKYNCFSGQYSLTCYLTAEQVSMLEYCTKSESYWSYLKNCSWFAALVWDIVTGDDLSSVGLWANPNTLINNIKQRSNCEYEKPIFATYTSPSAGGR